MKLPVRISFGNTSMGVIKTLIVSVIILVASCDERVEPVCNCSGKGSKKLDGMSAIVVNTMEGFRFLSPTTGFISPCVPMELQYHVDGLMLRLDGTVKATCDDANVLHTITYTEIDKLVVSGDSLFSRQPFGISIVKSENYGYGPGYGYKIFPAVGLKVEQPTMPAVQGYKPFKSASDAFKTAVLVSYKLYVNNSELPVITIADLTYLQVIY